MYTIKINKKVKYINIDHYILIKLNKKPKQ